MAELTDHYCIYQYPDDYPGLFVVRQYIVEKGVGHFPVTRPHAVTRTLSEARSAIPDGTVRLERTPFDEPAVVEVWVDCASGFA